MWEMRDAYWKDIIGTSSCRWEKNITIDFQEILWDNMACSV